MPTQRTVHDERELAAAFNESVDFIEILGSLSNTARRIKQVNRLKWAVVATTISASLPILLSTAGVGLPAAALGGATVVACLGAAGSVSAFWLAYYSGNLRALKALRVYKIACDSGDILVIKKPGDGPPDYLPKVGTEIWNALNLRRAVLIDKDLHGVLTSSEREELAELERICSQAVDREYPPPDSDLSNLVTLRDRLRSGREGVIE